MQKRTWSGTGRRLFLAFSAFIALYAFASLFALIGIVQIHDGLARTRARVDGMRVALDLASAVRDQYAHLAHTIIIGNASHRQLYQDASERVAALTAEMRRHTEQADEQAWVTEIEQATSGLDDIYRQRVLPDVLGNRADAVQTDHQEVLRVVGRIQQSTDHLARRFEAAIVELQTFVASVERRSFGWSLFFLLVAPLLAAWVGLAIGRSVAGPVARLSAGAARLAAGDLDARIDVGTQDEFGALAAQFNAMTAALKEHQTKLIQSEKLAGIGRLAAGVAHEINNPLGVILGYARLLKKKAEPGLADDLGVIEEETLRCRDIVDGLLDLSRPLQPSAEPVDLRELTDEIKDRLVETAPLDAAAVRIDGAAVVGGHPQKLRQVLLNLMKNAVEAAGPNGHVVVEIQRTAIGVSVTVRDSGRGVDAAHRGRLFEPFFTTKAAGTGLGLAVSRAIARAHGGDITFEAPAQGGAVFVLTLPGGAADGGGGHG